ISQMGRPTQGVRVMNLKKGDRVSAVALVVESENGNGNGASRTSAPVEEAAPSAENVAEEAAAAEAAGNAEAKVTRSKAPAARPRRQERGWGGSWRAKVPAKAKPAARKPKPAAKPKRAAKTKPAARKPKPAARPKAKVKPKHTATAKQRAETAAKKRA